MAKARIKQKKAFRKMPHSIISRAERNVVKMYVMTGSEERKRLRESDSIILNDGVKVKPTRLALKLGRIMRIPKSKQCLIDAENSK